MSKPVKLVNEGPAWSRIDTQSCERMLKYLSSWRRKRYFEFFIGLEMILKDSIKGQES